MKKLLITLSFLGTGTIVGAATLPAIVSCVPITHKQMIEQQINKDYVAIFDEIEAKNETLTMPQIFDDFGNLVFPKNEKMDMTHGYDVMQWNNIVRYTDNNGNGFSRDLIKMVDLKEKIQGNGQYRYWMKEFLKYDEILRIVAEDFNKYKNIFRTFSETRLTNVAVASNTEWNVNTSTTLNLWEYYGYLDDFTTRNNILIPEKDTIIFSNSLPLNPDFEKALALIVSFKNASLDIDKNKDESSPSISVSYRENGIINWLNRYWELSYNLGFLPSSYNSKAGNFNDEIIRTSQMDSFRTELFNQEVMPTKSKYYHIEHSVNIDNFLDDESNIDAFPPRWMNPKDLIDYYSSIINPLTIYGISNSLLRMVKTKKGIINEEGINMNLKFSDYLVENIYSDHWKLVLNKSDWLNQFGGETRYLNKNNNASGTLINRFLNSNQVDLSVDYKNVIKV